MQYAKRMVGRRMYGGTSTYIPLKVNQAGVIPVIFASSLLYLPQLALQLMGNKHPDGSASFLANDLIKPSNWVNITIYFLLIIFFTYFYVSITFNPTAGRGRHEEVRRLRAGRPAGQADRRSTSTTSCRRITLPGALYLAHHRGPAEPVHRLVGGNKQNFPFGGTAVLIIVGVGAGHGEADREPADAAQLRRVPAVVPASTAPRRAPMRRGECNVRLVLVGPPGAGKGTQAEFIAAHLAVPKISTGDIFRANVTQGTPLGLEAKRYMDDGKLVPDEVTINMVRERLAEPDASDGFLLDGFPRTVPQANELDKLLADLGHPARPGAGARGRRRRGDPAAVRPAQLPWLRQDLARRVRRADQTGVCDRCGGELFQRDDDKAETIAKRLRVYAEKTAPLIDFYGAQGKLVGIDATGPVEDITVARDRRAALVRWVAVRVPSASLDIQYQDARAAAQDARGRSGRARRAGERCARPSLPGSALPIWTRSPRRRSGSAGAMPSFKGYHGFPATICSSVNEQIVHAIPAATAGARRGRPDLDRLRRDPGRLARRRGDHGRRR